MKRRNFLVLSGGTAISTSVGALIVTRASLGQIARPKEDTLRLEPPKTGAIPVAFLISPHETVIDFTGPSEVFQDVAIDGK